jgi:hypothetical protein
VKGRKKLAKRIVCSISLYKKSLFHNEETMFFDSDSFELLKAIINGDENHIYGEYTLVRDY